MLKMHVVGDFLKLISLLVQKWVSLLALPLHLRLARQQRPERKKNRKIEFNEGAKQSRSINRTRYPKFIQIKKSAYQQAGHDTPQSE